MNVYMYVCLYGCMHYLIKHGLCHNSFMATGALGHIHVRLHVVGFQVPKKAQVNNTTTSIIIDTNIYIYIYIYIYMCVCVCVCVCVYIYIYIYIYSDFNYIKKEK